MTHSASSGSRPTQPKNWVALFQLGLLNKATSTDRAVQLLSPAPRKYAPSEKQDHRLRRRRQPAPLRQETSKARAAYRNLRSRMPASSTPTSGSRATRRELGDRKGTEGIPTGEEVRPGRPRRWRTPSRRLTGARLEPPRRRQHKEDRKERTDEQDSRNRSKDQEQEPPAEQASGGRGPLRAAVAGHPLCGASGPTAALGLPGLLIWLLRPTSGDTAGPGSRIPDPRWLRRSTASARTRHELIKTPLGVTFDSAGNVWVSDTGAITR